MGNSASIRVADDPNLPSKCIAVYPGADNGSQLDIYRSCLKDISISPDILKNPFHRKRIEFLQRLQLENPNKELYENVIEKIVHKVSQHTSNGDIWSEGCMDYHSLLDIWQQSIFTIALNHLHDIEEPAGLLSILRLISNSRQSFPTPTVRSLFYTIINRIPLPEDNQTPINDYETRQEIIIRIKDNLHKIILGFIEEFKENAFRTVFIEPTKMYFHISTNENKGNIVENHGANVYLAILQRTIGIQFNRLPDMEDQHCLDGYVDFLHAEMRDIDILWDLDNFGKPFELIPQCFQSSSEVKQCDICLFSEEIFQFYKRQKLGTNDNDLYAWLWDTAKTPPTLITRRAKRILSLFDNLIQNTEEHIPFIIAQRFVSKSQYIDITLYMESTAHSEREGTSPYNFIASGQVITTVKHRPFLLCPWIFTPIKNSRSVYIYNVGQNYSPKYNQNEDEESKWVIEDYDDSHIIISNAFHIDCHIRCKSTGQITTTPCRSETELWKVTTLSHLLTNTLTSSSGNISKYEYKGNVYNFIIDRYKCASMALECHKDGTVKLGVHSDNQCKWFIEQIEHEKYIIISAIYPESILTLGSSGAQTITPDRISDTEYWTMEKIGKFNYLCYHGNEGLSLSAYPGFIPLPLIEKPNFPFSTVPQIFITQFTITTVNSIVMMTEWRYINMSNKTTREESHQWARTGKIVLPLDDFQVDVMKRHKMPLNFYQLSRVSHDDVLVLDFFGHSFKSGSGMLRAQVVFLLLLLSSCDDLVIGPLQVIPIMTDFA
eukprot:gene2407-4675_t